MLDHFDESDNIEVSHAYDGCSLRKLEADEADDSFIWITNKYDKDSETYYHGELIDKQYELEYINKSGCVN